jgi:DNA-binding LacI/PurR family transcriptional regulator
MARHLIGLGHRSLAYLSAAHKFSWSQERLEGIRKQCSCAGLEHAVVPVVTDEMDVAYQHILALSGFPDAVIRKVTSIGASKSQAKSLYNAYLKFKKEWTPRQFASRDIRDFQRNFAFLISPLKEKMSEDFLDGVYSAFIVTAVRRMAAMSLTPLFQQALNNQAVTAWICASDDVALAALSFLKDHRIAVPGSLSVAGFDDRSYESLEHRLTTFDFNVSGAVHNMLNFIARPPRSRGPYRHRAIEVEGMVIERGTSGRPISV